MALATTRHRSRAKVRKATRRRPAAGEVRALRQRYGLSQSLLARLSNRLQLLTAGAQLRRNLTQARRLCEALGDSLESAFVGHWLDQPNEMLGGLKPVEATERGQIDRVWQVAEGLRSGSPL